MNDIYIAVLASLATGKKPCSEIAAELRVSSPKIAGALINLISNGLVSVAGKTRVGGKEVSVYALTSQQPIKKAAPPVPLVELSEEAIARMMDSNLYQLWGGFAPFTMPPAKVVGVRRYAES